MKRGITANNILAAYAEAGSIKGVERKLGISWQKIARCLVDNGICPNNTCAAIQMLSKADKSTSASPANGTASKDNSSATQSTLLMSTIPFNYLNHTVYYNDVNCNLQ